MTQESCRCAAALATMIRYDNKAVGRHIGLAEAVRLAQQMLRDDPSLHECERR